MRRGPGAQPELPDGSGCELKSVTMTAPKLRTQLDTAMGRALLRELEASSQTIFINEGPKGNGFFGVSNGQMTIGVDPSTGFSVKTGLISPAMVLFHESVHAAQYLNDPKAYIYDYGNNTDFIETWALAYEGKMAATLNEPVRTSHREGIPTPVPSPTTHYVLTVR